MRKLPVTAIVPTHSHVEYLEQSIRSIVEQTCPPAEIIVVADNPTPAMRMILPSVAKMARVVLSDRQLGTSGARNLGIDAATQPFLAFNDDDDLWEPFRLERGWTHLERHPDSDGMFSAIWYQHRDGRREYSFQDEGRLDMSKAIWRNPGSIQTLLVRTEIVRRMNGFDPEIGSCEDHDFAIRLVESGARIDYTMEPTAVIRRHSSNQSDLFNVLRVNHRKLVQKHRHLLVQVYGRSGPRQQYARNMRLYGRQTGGISGRLWYYAGVVLGNFERRVYLE